MSRPCWAPQCGRTDTRRYVNYSACPGHTPAKTRERHGSPWPVWVGVALVVTLLAGVVVTARHHDAANRLRPCPTEDSANCLWISRHGGRNFVNVGGVVLYLDGQP